MAVMKALFAASVLASLVSAVPMPGRMDRRAAIYHTETYTTWTTVDITTTVYVNDANPTPPPQAPAPSEAAPTSAPAPPPAPAAAPSSSAPAPAVSPANFAPEPAPAAAYTPPPPPPSSTSAAPAPANTVNIATNSGGPCEGEGSGCKGDITYYNGGGGYGACGSLINDANNNVALPYQLMGTQSNGNPYCGRTVNIKGPDGSVHQGTVVDKCMGCSGDSIDLSPPLFSAVAPSGDGRVSNIEWWF